MPDTEQLTPEEQIEAIDKADFKTLCDMIKKGQLPLTTTLKNTTALHLIVTYKRHNQLLEWILKNRLEVNINAKSDTKSTPLIMAANIPNFEAMKILIEHGADTEVINVNGRTARDVLVSKRLHEEVKLFDQAVKAYHKKNSNQSVQDKKESLAEKTRFSWQSLTFLNFCTPNFLSNRKSKKEDKQVMTPLIDERTRKEKIL